MAGCVGPWCAGAGVYSPAADRGGCIMLAAAAAWWPASIAPQWKPGAPGIADGCSSSRPRWLVEGNALLPADPPAIPAAPPAPLPATPPPRCISQPSTTNVNLVRPLKHRESHLTIMLPRTKKNHTPTDQNNGHFRVFSPRETSLYIFYSTSNKLAPLRTYTSTKNEKTNARRIIAITWHTVDTWSVPCTTRAGGLSASLPPAPEHGSPDTLAIHYRGGCGRWSA